MRVSKVFINEIQLDGNPTIVGSYTNEGRLEIYINDNVVFAFTDCTEEDARDLCNKFGINWEWG